MTLASPRDLAAATAGLLEPARSSTVSAMLPGYDRYARVLNPARELGVRVTWASLACREMRPDLQWDELRRIAPHASDIEPEMGTIDPDTASELVAVLRSRTSTPQQCTYLVWEGYAGLTTTAATAPTITLGALDRTMHVLEGTIDDALENLEEPPFHRLPVWWLPVDRAWSMGGDIYGRSVFIGGTANTITRLTQHPELEAVPIAADYGVGGEDI